jgi:hypothetical protein
VFYFQLLFAKALGGIDATSIIPAITTVAYVILAIGFLTGLYRAAMRGGDVQSALSSALIYLIVALIIANWGSAFRGVNDAFNQIAQAIGNSSGVGDMFTAWLNQIQQQSQTNPGMSLWDAITGDASGVITVLLLVVAYVLFALAMIVFCFFYTLYGTVLYVLGPLILAFLPIAGANQVAKSYTVNLMIWNAWGILYAAFGALMTAIHVNRVNDVLGNGFVGFLRGVPDSILLGIVSIFYALSIALIPLIASKIISGDVGATAFSLVRSAALVVSTAITAGAALAGAAAAGGGSAGGGASGGGGGAGAAGGGGGGANSGSGTGSGSGGGLGTSSATTSSPPPTPPPIPTVAQMLQTGIARAVNGSIGSSGGESEGSSAAPPPASPHASATGGAHQSSRENS